MKIQLLLLLLAAGILLGSSVSFTPDQRDLLLVAAGLVGLLVFQRYYSSVIYPLVFVAGVFWALVFAHQTFKQQLPVYLEGKDILLQGVISNLPQHSSRATRFDLTLMPTPGFEFLPDKIKLSWYHSVDLLPGQVWQLRVRLKRPRGLMNPNGFDYQGWMLQQGYGASGYVRTSDFNQLRLDQSVPFRHQILISFNRLRQYLAKKIILSEIDPAFKPVLLALSIGSSDGLSNDQWQVLRKTGTNHLLVISGLHVGIIAGIGFWVGNFLFRVLMFPLWVMPASVWGNVCALLSAIFYSGLAGFSLPVTRATIMVLCFLMASLFRKKLQVSLACSVALVIVLLLDPLAGFSISFWLSFGAVIVLLFCFSARYSLLGAGRGLWHILGKAQWVVFIGIFPLLWLWTGGISLISPLVNMLAIPWLGFVLLPCVLLTIVCAVLVPDYQGLFAITETVVSLLWGFLEFMKQLQSYYYLPVGMQDYFWVTAIAMLGVVVLLLPAGVIPRVAGILLILPVVIPVEQKFVEGEFRLTMLDVGQGLSVVVETDDHVTVFDTGEYFSDRFDIGRHVLAPFLRSRGHRSIDTLIVSHGDKDHAGGTQGLLEEIPVKLVLSGAEEKLANKNIRSVACREGQKWKRSGVQFTVLGPPQGLAAESMKNNNRSCVLKISNGRFAALLTGDIEEDQEWRLLREYGQQLQADILLVPHHGSKTSSSPAFINSVNPQLALVSVGYRNRFNHPHPDIIKRYSKKDIVIARTDQQGAIVLDIGLESIQPPEIWRSLSRRYWHHW